MVRPRLRPPRIVMVLAIVFVSPSSSATTDYYAGTQCIGDDLEDTHWKADYGGLFYTETALSDGTAFCGVSPPATNFTPTYWKVRIWDRSTTACLRCQYFHMTIGGSIFVSPTRYSASTAGGTMTCSNPSYTGFNSLSTTISEQAMNITQAGFKCEIPNAASSSVQSSIMGYNLTY